MVKLLQASRPGQLMFAMAADWRVSSCWCSGAIGQCPTHWWVPYGSIWHLDWRAKSRLSMCYLHTWATWEVESFCNLSQVFQRQSPPSLPLPSLRQWLPLLSVFPELDTALLAHYQNRPRRLLLVPCQRGKTWKNYKADPRRSKQHKNTVPKTCYL